MRLSTANASSTRLGIILARKHAALIEQSVTITNSKLTQDGEFEKVFTSEIRINTYGINSATDPVFAAAYKRTLSSLLA